MIRRSFLEVATVATRFPRRFAILAWNRESCDSGSYRVWTWTDSVRIHLRYAEPSLLMLPYFTDDADCLTVGTSPAYAHSFSG